MGEAKHCDHGRSVAPLRVVTVSLCGRRMNQSKDDVAKSVIVYKGMLTFIATIFSFVVHGSHDRNIAGIKMELLIRCEVVVSRSEN